MPKQYFSVQLGRKDGKRWEETPVTLHTASTNAERRAIVQSIADATGYTVRTVNLTQEQFEELDDLPENNPELIEKICRHSGLYIR